MPIFMNHKAKKGTLKFQSALREIEVVYRAPRMASLAALPATSAAICDLESAFAIGEFDFVDWLSVVRLARIKTIHPRSARRKITFSHEKWAFFALQPAPGPACATGSA